MSSALRNWIWFISAVTGVGMAVACVLPRHPAVALTVMSVERTSGSPVARCEIRNQGVKPIQLTTHSLNHTPFYQHLEKSAFSWRRVLLDLDWRSVNSWHQAAWDMQCGLDAETKTLVPGQSLPFTASIVDTSQPVRLAVSYQLDGTNFTISSPTIHP